MIPQETISDIKFRNPIEDVIGSYVTLKRSGATMKGLCPFHSEKTPSFTVFTATQGYYCFGCGAGGDVITFIRQMENLEYIPALEFLAKRAGIALPESRPIANSFSLPTPTGAASSSASLKEFMNSFTNQSVEMPEPWMYLWR